MKIFKLLRKQLHNKGYLLLHLRSFFLKFLILNKGSEVVVSIHDTTIKVLSSMTPPTKFYQVVQII